MRTDYVCVLLHCSVVGLHATEIFESRILTLSVIIALVYAMLSATEVIKYFKERRL